MPAPSNNGYHPAPPPLGGAVRTPAPTQFPPEVFVWRAAPLLYLFGNTGLLDITLPRISLTVVLITAVIALLAWPLGYVWPAVLALALSALLLAFAVLRRGDFVRFSEQPLPEVPQQPPAPVLPSDKIPVYATGALSVDFRVRRFTFLPAVYRTFATREHAVIGLCRARRFLAIASWPERDLGLWYAFIQPASVRGIRVGVVRYGRNDFPALAIEYRAEWATRRGLSSRDEAIFLVARETSAIQRVLADLTEVGRVPVEQS